MEASKKRRTRRGLHGGLGDRSHRSDDDPGRSPFTSAPPSAQLTGSGNYQIPVAPGGQVWTIVFRDDRPVGVTIHIAADRWVPLPLSDRRARQFVDRFLREGSNE
jgi:hypothetical protein